MANTPQAKKRIRRNDKRAEINGARMSRIRSFVKKVEAALDAGDKDAAKTALQAAQPEIALATAAKALAHGPGVGHRCAGAGQRRADADAIRASARADEDRPLMQCRLHIAIQWLGWARSWNPPAEHVQDWLQEAFLNASLLGLT